MMHGLENFKFRYFVSLQSIVCLVKTREKWHIMFFSLNK